MEDGLRRLIIAKEVHISGWILSLFSPPVMTDLRCHLKEYIRGEYIPWMVNPGSNKDVLIYQAYLNYTEDDPANSLKFNTDIIL